MSNRAYKLKYEGKKNITTFQYCQSRKPIMRLREVLYKPQLPKASHYKRDKQCEKEILLLMDVRFIWKKF